MLLCLWFDQPRCVWLDVGPPRALAGAHLIVDGHSGHVRDSGRAVLLGCAQGTGGRAGAAPPWELISSLRFVLVLIKSGETKGQRPSRTPLGVSVPSAWENGNSGGGELNGALESLTPSTPEVEG